MIFEELLKRGPLHPGAGAAVQTRAAYDDKTDRRTMYDSRTCQLQYGANRRGRARGRRLAWQSTAGRRLGCHGDKQGCLHQRQISAVSSGGHTYHSTNSNGESSGPGMRNQGGLPFPYHLVFPRNFFSTAGLIHTHMHIHTAGGGSLSNGEPGSHRFNS